MVAGRDSCSCAQCGAVCLGMFPGCASVWAAGPRPAPITRPGKESAVLAPVAEPAAPSVAPPAPNPAEASELHALRVDMQVLMWKFDQLQQPAPAGEELAQAAKDLGAVARALPKQVQEAVSAALVAQRKAAQQMFAQIEQEISDDIGQMREKLQRELRPPPSAPAGPPVSVADLDARFQWLVEAVSERFITLGNGLARIERQMAPETADANGAPANGTATHFSGGNGTSGRAAGNGSAAGNGGGLGYGERWRAGSAPAASAETASPPAGKARP